MDRVHPRRPALDAEARRHRGAAGVAGDHGALGSRRGAKLLQLGAVLAFVGFTVVAFAGDPVTAAFVDRYARAIAAGLLATIALGSLLVVPFTEQYARETVPRQLWSSPQFTQINRKLTTMWGLVFGAMVPAHVIAGTLDTHRANLIFNWAIPIALVV